MSHNQLTLLAVGASGSIGRHVVDQALQRGYRVRALVRDPGNVKPRPGLEVVQGDLTAQQSLNAALQDVDAVVFTHGTYGSIAAAEAVDYGGVRNVLAELGDRRVHIALMTAIAVTDRKGAHDWKRRAERLVRRSGHPFTIIRPGWFDYNDADQMQLVFLQGDKRQSGSPRDGVIARRQIARVLLDSLTLPEAARRTLELVADHGAEQDDLAPLFSGIDADPAAALDGVHDADNMPLVGEPKAVRETLDRLSGSNAPIH